MPSPEMKNAGSSSIDLTSEPSLTKADLNRPHATTDIAGEMTRPHATIDLELHPLSHATISKPDEQSSDNPEVLNLENHLDLG